MVPVQLRYTNVSSWRVASDAQAGGDDAQLVCEHQLCRWQWYWWVFYSAKHLFLSDMMAQLGRPQVARLPVARCVIFIYLFSVVSGRRASNGTVSSRLLYH